MWAKQRRAPRTSRTSNVDRDGGTTGGGRRRGGRRRRAPAGVVVAWRRKNAIDDAQITVLGPGDRRRAASSNPCSPIRPASTLCRRNGRRPIGHRDGPHRQRRGRRGRLHKWACAGTGVNPPAATRASTSSATGPTGSRRKRDERDGKRDWRRKWHGRRGSAMLPAGTDDAEKGNKTAKPAVSQFRSNATGILGARQSRHPGSVQPGASRRTDIQTALPDR
jgi:hypothetical protein